MGFYRGPQIVRDGLVLYLDAGNKKSYPASGTTWTDITGNGNNGTLVNGPTFDSSNGGSIVFDGVNDRVDGTLINNIDNSPFTISVWLKPRSFGSRTYFSLGTGIGDLRRRIHLRLVSPTSIRFGMWNDDLNTTLLNVDNQWTNIICSLSNNFIQQVYQNGIFRGSRVAGGFFIGNNSYRIGSWDGEEFINTDISQVQIYNRALTPEEIQQNYNATKGRFNL